MNSFDITIFLLNVYVSKKTWLKSEAPAGPAPPVDVFLT